MSFALILLVREGDMQYFDKVVLLFHPALQYASSRILVNSGQ